MLTLKLLLGFSATLLSICAFIPYIRSILRGTTRPHVFSWVIWGTSTFTVFLAQLSDNGGAGAWPIGVSGVITFYVAFLAYQKKGDSTITRMDWVFFVIAMSAIPAWYITANALTAVLLLTAIDLTGYAPTLRKAYHKPYEEQALMYVLMSVRNGLAILALEHYSWTTLTFLVATMAANGVVISLIGWRRVVVGR